MSEPLLIRAAEALHNAANLVTAAEMDVVAHGVDSSESLLSELDMQAKRLRELQARLEELHRSGQRP